MDLIDRLYHKINETPWSPKVLLAQSYAQGHQLLEQICKRYGAIFNIEVQTPWGVVTANAKSELFRRKVTLLDEDQVVWVVRQLMKQLAEKNPEGYITESLLKPGIVKQVSCAITDMRLAGIDSDEVWVEHFTSQRKGEYLKRLLAAYEVYLLEHARTDFAGLAPYLKPGTGDKLYLTIAPSGWTQVEQIMIHKLSAGQLCILDAEDPFYINQDFSNNGFKMFRAAGSLAEVKEGFRRILSEQAPLDRMEIILSDYEQYAPIIHSHAEGLGIACTFSNGLPLVYCAAGKAAAGIVDWIAEGFPVHRLTDMLRHGYISFPEERWSRADWVRLLEKSAIGWSRERYLAVLRPERLSEQDREQGAVLYSHMKNWFDRLPEGNEWDPVFLLGWVSDFVQRYVPARSVDDADVGTMLTEMTRRYSLSPSEPMPMDIAVQYVKEMLTGITIRSAAVPKQGVIHISSLQNGGWSGRDVTWIVGMDERTWSISALQDPLLLDQEREKLSTHLESAKERVSKIRSERESRLSNIRGNIWLSYSSYDVGEQKSTSPAFEMLQVLRLQLGDMSIDFGTLEHSLGEPYSVMDIMHSVESSVPLDEVDAWSGLLQGANYNCKDGWNAVLQTYPALAAGYQAQTSRQYERLSAYDGWLEIVPSSDFSDPDDPPHRDAISVSQLEKYASCGLQYYFHYVLKLRPKDNVEFDQIRWLQASERGTLLHDVFRRYLEVVTDHGAKRPIHSRERLVEIMESVIRENALSVPAPSAHVFAKECEEIRCDVEIFYIHETGRTGQPSFFELELTNLDGEPMEIHLPGGVRFKLKGFVDRVDRIGPHEYRITDYKTGSTGKYKDSEYFCGGTQLQHAIYSIAVEQWLRETGKDPEAKVTEAEYYFPTERGRGENVIRLQNRREELTAIIAKLLDSRNRGVYIPTKEPKVCQWCDYQAVCGSHSEWMVEKRGSAVNVDILNSLLEVESIG
ncbi:ATP-dependent nuclease subunit B-like protein [Paenibacillus algicola]|uniref:ATP-dependent nuclease subunit B-like protein n=1 Tax=Paenibacillus algicola TaxID=2565926 RepID=A0A4P8XH13_9BACL|nr:PD-(D/E)XK nuclease family protein [Paenibacillus algicola]QCT01578.1 ATP-dependent nuclease subunit B-like protein [Paenibacillus algicola]